MYRLSIWNVLFYSGILEGVNFEFKAYLATSRDSNVFGDFLFRKQEIMF